MIPTSRRTRLASRTTSWPAIFTLPEVRPRVVVRIEMVVVLPAPFGPSSAKNCPCSTSKLTPSTAFTVPFRYRLTRSRTSIAGAIATELMWSEGPRCGMPYSFKNRSGARGLRVPTKSSGRGRPPGALHHQRQAAGQENSRSPAEDGPQAQRAFGLLGAGQRTTRHHIASVERINDDRAANTGSRLPADHVLAMVAHISEYARRRNNRSALELGRGGQQCAIRIDHDQIGVRRAGDVDWGAVHDRLRVRSSVQVARRFPRHLDLRMIGG